MPNIHGLHSLRTSNNNSNRDHNDDDSDDEEGNDRYVGGVDSRGGGSGLAVLPNNRDHQNRNNNNASSSSSDAIFNLAEADTGGGSTGGRSRGGGGSGGGVHRTIITMYRSGFTVDDGPYRRLDDPSNSEFLTSMARGHVPRELRELAIQNHSGGGEGEDEPEVMVGLVDRRGEEYDPEKHAGGGSSGSGNRRGSSGGESSGFQSFSGEGQSLGGASSASGGAAAASGGGGGASAAGGGVIHPSSSSTPLPLDPNLPSTSIAIRLFNGSRLVIKVNTSVPVSEIGHHIGNQAGGSAYVLTSGYPPRIVEDLSMSIEEAGLMGSQVVLKAV